MRKFEVAKRGAFYYVVVEVTSAGRTDASRRFKQARNAQAMADARNEMVSRIPDYQFVAPDEIGL